ncbi:hypothetical protein F4604DRAFT_1040059 [Suillus subluteus]|nr:hypothetical protein F4604DRAFT_1040059 [Suillus subluteus]
MLNDQCDPKERLGVRIVLPLYLKAEVQTGHQERSDGTTKHRLSCAQVPRQDGCEFTRSLQDFIIFAIFCRLATPTADLPQFPFLTLLISGGHTLLLLASSLTSFQILATTADGSIGRAFDKAARALGCPGEPEALVQHSKSSAAAA